MKEIETKVIDGTLCYYDPTFESHVYVDVDSIESFALYDILGTIFMHSGNYFEVRPEVIQVLKRYKGLE